MPLRFASIVIDCADAQRVGSFWAELLGRPLGGPDDEGDLWIDAGEQNPELLFQPVPEGKAVKNRIHFDLRPEEQATEVERAIALGATPADVGQLEVTWVVLADPEGNEFCILRAKRSGES